MKVPKLIYNPELPDQSAGTYLESYRETAELIEDRIENGSLLGFSREEMTRALFLCRRLEIISMIYKILEDHCDCEPQIVIEELDGPSNEEDSSHYSLMA